MNREEIAKVLELWDSGHKEFAALLVKDFHASSDVVVDNFTLIMDGLKTNSLRYWKVLWVPEETENYIAYHSFVIAGVDLQGNKVHTHGGGYFSLDRILRII